MKKRGVLIKGWSIVLIAFLSLLMISYLVNAPAGCCVNPRYSYNICQDISIEECCGLEGSYPDWDYCNTTYAEGTCAENPNCAGGPGCCIYEDRCSDVLYQSQCTSTGGVDFRQGVFCDTQPDCITGCCTYVSEGQTLCEYTQYITCVTTFNESEPPFFNSSMSEAECSAECQALPTGSGDITGTVFNITGELLEGVTVEAASFSTTTASDGTYTLTNIPIGYTTVIFLKPGFETVYESVNIPLDDVIELDTTLTPIGTAIIKGTISSAGAPLDGALVVLNPGGNYYITSTSGFYQFVVDAPVSYTVTASKTGYSTDSDSVSVEVEELSTVNLFLTAITPSDITGYVKYNGTVPVETGITVRIQGTAFSALTDSNGRYELTDLAPGTYTIYAEAPNPYYNPEYRTVSLGADEVVNVNISLFGVTAGVLCSDLNGFCCEIGETCGENAHTTDDCNVCCDVECTIEISDTDDDFYPDSVEPLCMWEEALHDPQPEEPPLPEREGWDLGTCDDGIDNDCDSTGFYDLGPPLIANSEDLLDPDCRFCPLNPCDSLDHRWCNETKAQELIADGTINPLTQTPYDLDLDYIWKYNDDPEFDYCSDRYCSEDPVCTTDCQLQGHSCCYQCFGGAEPLGYACAEGSGQICCDNALGGCESELTITCCDYDWSCNGYAVPEGYPGAPYGCTAEQTACFAPCVIPNCLLDTSIDDPANVDPDGTLLQDATVCNCEGLRNTTASGTPDTGYCCLTGEYRSDSSECPALLTGTVRGNVVDTNTDPIDQAEVSIAGKFDQTDIDGDFEIAVVPVGLQTITARKIDYVTNTTTIDVIEGFNEINFILQTGVGCGDLVPPTIEDFAVGNIQGQIDKLLLTWTNPCPDDIEGFFINVVPEGLAEYNLNIGPEITSYPDQDLAWDTLYTYTIVAQYRANENYPTRHNTPVTATGNPGNQLCENRQLDWQFCVSQDYDLIKPLTIGVYCDEENQLLDIPLNCLNPQEGGVNYVCVELYGGTVECREQIECRDVTEGEPFGLYYNLQNCVNDTSVAPVQSRNCYYDYTNTTVDACFSCGESPSCFDYSSELACAIDNCRASTYEYPINENCTWYDGATYYAEFGKGICYKPYYNDTDYCNRCNRFENQPFDNPDCTFQVCSRLGMCYSEDNEDLCQECSEFTECEFFDDEKSCIGIDKYDFIESRNFNIPSFILGANESYDYFNYSLDACGLQRCRWGIPGGEATPRCYKDGDNDDVPDCEKDTQQDQLCRQDQEAPITSITNIPDQETGFINSESYTLILEILGLGDQGTSRFLKNIQIKYCLDNSNSCMPNNSIDLSTLKNIQGEDFTINLTLPNDVYNETHIPQNTVYVRFFSKDYHNNTETIKSASVFIDTIRPEVNVSWLRINDTQQRSNLTLNVTVDSLSDCSDDSLIYVNDPSWTPSETGIEPGTGRFFETNYTGLLDGFYYYTVTCEEGHENKKTVTTNVHIDRVQIIYDEHPDTFIPTAPEHEERLNNIFTTNTILFHVKTPSSFGSNVVCKFFDNNWIELPFVFAGVHIEKGAYREFNVTYTVAGPTTYNFPVECNDSTTRLLLDTTLFRFTVDNLAPRTSLGYKDKFGFFHSFNASGFYISSTEFNLSCKDDDLSAPGMPYPGEAGCKEIRICTDLICADPASYRVYTPGTLLTFAEDAIFNFSSIDRKDNLEVVNSTFIQIDDDAPELIIDFPPNNFITNQNPFPLGHAIEGTWTDRAGLKNLKAILTDSDNNIRISFINIIGNTFTGFLPILSQGLNNIRLEGEDYAGNIGDVSIDIYLDEIGPEYNYWEVKKADGTRIDNESSCTDNCFIEWGKDMIFNVSINDVEWTAIGTQDNGVSVNIDYGHLTWDIELGTTNELDFNTTFSFNPDPFGLPASYFEKPGKWNIIFNATDVFGNHRTKEIWFYVNDTIEPTFTVEILDEENNPTNFMVRNKDYTINIVSSEPLSSPPILKYSPDGRSDEEFVPLTYADGGDFIFTSIDPTTVPRRPGFDYLIGDNNNAEWIITGTDVNGVPGDSITPKEFIIDTLGPEQPLILNLDKFEYTKKTDIFVAGITANSETGLNVTLKLNDVTENIFEPSDWNPINSTISAEDHGSRYHNIEIFIDVGLGYLIGGTDVTLEGTFGDDVVGDYIGFKNEYLEGIERENLKYYMITNVETRPETKTFVEFTPPLEDEILTSYEAYIYEDELPTGWFGFNLTNLIEGSNWIYVLGTDIHGLEGEILQENVYDIIYDKTEPSFYNEGPMDGRVENNNKTNISIKVSDIIPVTNVSKINRSSIILWFNSTVEHLCGDGQLECSPAEGFKEEYELSVDPDNLGFIELPMGEYTINVTAKDRLGNENTRSWKFTIDPTVPDYPKYFIYGSFDPKYIERDERDTWYTNDTTPLIIANFASNVSIVNHNLTLNDFLLEINMGVVNSDYTFNFTTEALAEEKYTLALTARKIFNLTPLTLGNPVSDYIDIVVDITEPDVTNLSVVNKSDGSSLEKGRNFTIKADIIERSPNATVEYDIRNAGGSVMNGRITVPDIQEHTPYYFSHEIKPNRTGFGYTPGYGEHTLILNVIDAFGKEDITETSFFMNDSIGPKATLSVISPGRITRKNYGKTRINRPTIEIQTDEYARSCSAFGGEKSFTTTDDLTFSATFDDPFILPNGQTVIEVRCIDYYGNDETIKMTIVVDTTPPSFISLDWDLDLETENLIKSYTFGRITNLTLETSETTICKYIGNLTAYMPSPESISYVDMVKKFTGFDEEDFGIKHSVDLTSEMESITGGVFDNNNFTYYVACEDEATNIVASLGVKSIIVDIGRLRITSIRFDTGDETNNVSPTLIVDTDVDSDCRYKEEAGDFADFSTGQGTLYHEQLLGPFTDNIYTYFVECNWTLSPDVSNKANISIKIDTVVSPLNLTNILDEDGNAIGARTNNVNLTLNGTAEAGAFVEAIINDDYSYGNTYNNISSNDNSFTINIPDISSIAGDGEYRIRVKATDTVANLPNSNESNEIIFTLDTAPPAVPVLWPLPPYTNSERPVVYGKVEEPDADIVVTVDDNNLFLTPQDFAGTARGISNNITRIAVAESSSAGLNQINISDSDLGNVNVGDFIEFDEHAPPQFKYYEVTFKWNIPASPKTLLNVSPALIADVSSGEMFTTFDTGYPTGWFNITATLELGDNYVSAKAIDDLNNPSDYDTLQKVIYDNKEPAITVIEPQENEYINDNQTAIRASIEDEDVGINTATIRVTLDGATYNYSDNMKPDPITGIKDFVLTFTPPEELSETLHTVKFEAYDLARNFKDKEWSFTVDLSVPSDPVMDVTDGKTTTPEKWFSENLQPVISANFTEDITINNLNFSDGTTTIDVTVASTGNNYTFTLQQALASETQYYLEMNVSRTFQVGSGTPKIFTYEIYTDTEIPVVSNSNIPSPVELGDNVTIRVDAQDAGIGIDKAIADVNGILYEMSLETGTTYNYTLVQPNAGTYSVGYYFNDSLGHINNFESDSFAVVDTIGPEVNPIGPFITNNVYETISAELSDLSDIDWTTIGMRIRGTLLASAGTLSGDIVTYNLTSYYQGSLTYNVNNGKLIYVPTANLSDPDSQTTTLEISVSTNDMNQNSNSRDWTVFIDTRIPSPPTVLLNSTILQLTVQGRPDYINYVSVPSLVRLTVDFSAFTPELNSLSYVFSDQTKVFGDDKGDKSIQLDLINIEEERYWINISVETYIENQAQYRYVFHVDRTILPNLTRPFITLLRPNVVPEGSFNAFTPRGSDIPVKIRTDEPATCTLQKPGESVWSFSTTDNIVHELIYTPDLRKGEHLFNINCSDYFNKPSSEQMRLLVDFDNPLVFNVNADPNPVILQTETLSTFTANTNELARCKYINDDRITEQGLNINNPTHRRDIFELGRWFDSSVNYLTSHSHALRQSDLREGLNGNYTFYVMCEDRAERLSINNPDIKLEVDVDWQLGITNKGPQGTINDPTPELFVDTNLDATCTAFSEDRTFYENILLVLFGAPELEGAYRHIIQLPLSFPYYEGDYEHGVTYTYTVDCQAVDNPAKTASETVSFTTDFVLTAPTIYLASPVNDSTVTTADTFIAGTITSIIEIIYANLTLNNNQFWDLYSPNDGNLEFNVSVTLIEGLNNFTIMATTELSEFAAEETYFVTLDTTGPEGVIDVE